MFQRFDLQAALTLLTDFHFGFFKVGKALHFRLVISHLDDRVH